MPIMKKMQNGYTFFGIHFSLTKREHFQIACYFTFNVGSNTVYILSMLTDIF